MWKAFINCWKVPEIKRRILITAGILILCRLAANIPCPGVDVDQLKKAFELLADKGGSSGDISTMLDLFTGGGMQRFGIAALGIMPYITASIIMSLLGPVVPTIEKWRREGESGQQKMTQWTRYLTLGICVVQGSVLAAGMAYYQKNPLFSGITLDKPLIVSSIHPQWFILQSIIILMCGTMLLMWLGEQITDKGFGQGASLIITIGIIARLPQAIMRIVRGVRAQGEGAAVEFSYVVPLILLAVFCIVTAAIVALTLGVRKIPIQYARARAGRSGGIQGGAGQGSFFPLRVNHAGVMPIIFANTLLMVPNLILRQVPSWNLPIWAKNFTSAIGVAFDRGSGWFMVIYASLILFFCFFWVNSQFNPIRIADDLKRSSAYVPGYKPGQETADHLWWTMTRITTFGACSLTLVALLPMLFSNVIKLDYLIAQFFGGTSMLIMVGVMLDTMRQMETMLLSHGGYESFMKKGRMRGRRGSALPGISSQ